MEKRKEIVMSGIRPTGFLHLGNYFGAVRNYVRMQEDFECYFMVADLHSLTTHPDTKELKANVHRVLAENIACGLDPDKVALYCQSHIYETAELYLYLNMLAYKGELEKTVTFKDKVRQHPDNVNAGLLTYPVLQTAGRYILNDNDVSEMEDNALAEVRNKEIGFVFQQFNLLPRLTAAENVALPLVYAGMNRKLRTEKAMQVLEMVNLTDRSHHKPNELSGGQCQRVAIARALVNNPSIILADEPTGNLDTKTSYEIMEIFNTIHTGGNTIVLVTHEEDIANHAHRIVRLRDGIIESDKKNENVGEYSHH